MTRLLAVPLLFSCLLISTASALPFPVHAAMGRDLTADYEALMSGEEPVWRSAHSAELRKYKIVFVPGFLSTVILGLGSHKLARVARLGEYFDEHLRWLTSLGIESERIEYSYEGEPGENAPSVLDAVKRSSKPVIIVAHSKGGLDTISALMSMDKDLLVKVKGLLAIQVPFYGSPIASCFNEIKAKRYFARWAMPKLNLSFGALESLDSRRRSSSSSAMHEEIAFMEGLAKAIPVVSFASYKDREIDYTNPWQFLTGQDTLLFYSRTVMEEKYSLKNDGLVPVSSALIPGSDYIVVGNVDHAVPVMYCQILKFDRIRFFQSMLRLLLKK